MEDWKIARAIRDYDRQQRSASQNQSFQNFVQKLVQDGNEKFSDFNQVATQEGNPTLPITPGMLHILQDFERPADVAYYLGKNPVECMQISQMSPVQAARALGRIETNIDAELKKQTSQPSKTITKAPAPITPTKSGEVVTKDPDKMSQAEYEEWRRSSGARLY